MSKQRVRHQFGGCNRLLSQYKVIGTELLRYEEQAYQYGYSLSPDYSEFRQGVSYIPVETMESYLEDLLDLEVSTERLFIFREPRLHASFLSLGGLLFAICTGLYAASSGASLILAFGLTVCLALPFAVLWHYTPREGLMRRVYFAQVLSHEISRRRGDRDGSESSRPTLVLHRFLGRKAAPRSAQGAALNLIQ